MPPQEWWIVTVGTGGLVLMCAALAFDGARRVGLHTTYGVTLAAFSLSYWLVLIAFLSFSVPPAKGLPPRTEHGLDLIDLFGWTLQVTALAAIVAGFARSFRRLLVPIGASILAFLSLLLALHDLEGSRLGAALAYMVVDGAAFGLSLAVLGAFRRARNTAFGRLYLLLSAAFGLKAIGDLLYYTAGPDASSPVFLAAALVGATGWIAHARGLARAKASVESFAQPHLSTEQRVLRDAVRAARGIAGPEAGGILLAAACDALSRRAIPYTVDGDIVHADASPEAWAEALAEVSRQAAAQLGPRAQGRFIEIAEAFGEEHARAMRGGVA